MAKLILNDCYEVQGRVSVEAIYDINSDLKEIHGQIVLDDVEYLTIPLTKIRAPRFEVSGVRIVGESVGSEDEEIIYHFNAQEYSVYPRGVTL